MDDTDREIDRPRRKMASALCAAAAVLACASMSVAWGQTASARGEVRRVDAADGKVAIKHDAISKLDLPAMTLVYEVEPALLTGIQPGDKVSFTATRKDGKYVVTQLSK